MEIHVEHFSLLIHHGYIVNALAVVHNIPDSSALSLHMEFTRLF
jgi:hypothetical protein